MCTFRSFNKSTISSTSIAVHTSLSTYFLMSSRASFAGFGRHSVKIRRSPQALFAIVGRRSAKSCRSPRASSQRLNNFGDNWLSFPRSVHSIQLTFTEIASWPPSIVRACTISARSPSEDASTKSTRARRRRKHSEDRTPRRRERGEDAITMRTRPLGARGHSKDASTARPREPRGREHGEAASTARARAPRAREHQEHASAAKARAQRGREHCEDASTTRSQRLRT